MNGRRPVGVLGATGTVGQALITALAAHPWFRVAWVGASERSAGKPYAEAAPWRLPTPRPDEAAAMTVRPCRPDGDAPPLVFSGLDAAVAGEVEAAFAEAGHTVVSNARNYRMAPDVPLLIPEINPDHLQLLDRQSAVRGWRGRIVTNPNCAAIAITLALAPLRAFGLTRVLVSTLQAISGAGYPGVASLDITANVLPHIRGEEDKMETETQKILGAVEEGAVVPHPVVVSAQATRVPVIDGHTALVSVELDDAPAAADLRAAFDRFAGRPQAERLPTAPTRPIHCTDDPDRPQPRLDAGCDGGMAVTVGRIRPCPVLDYKFVALGHNTVRGAAGAAILNAELMQVDGRLD